MRKNNSVDISANSDFLYKIGQNQVWYENGQIIVRDENTEQTNSCRIDANSDVRTIARELSTELNERK